MNNTLDDYALETSTLDLLSEIESNFGKHLLRVATEIARDENSYIELDGTKYVDVTVRHVESACLTFEAKLKIILNKRE